MSLLVKFNYGIAACVILLGFVASYVSYQRNNPMVSVQPLEQPAPESVPQPMSPQAVPPARSADWKYECKLSLEGMEDCKATQRLLWEDGKTEALMAILLMVDRDGLKTPRLKLITPLGAFLPGGLTMRIDTEEPFIVPFQFCAADGCFVNLDLAPDVVEAMQREGHMTVEYMTPEQKTANVQVSLRGVRDVLAKIAQ